MIDFSCECIRTIKFLENPERLDQLYIDEGIPLDSDNWFFSLEDAMEKNEIWREEYNTFRPHSCLGDLTPEMFIEKQVKTAQFSTLEHS